MTLQFDHHLIYDQLRKMCNVTVTLNGYKRNWYMYIACDLSESRLVLGGAFLFFVGHYKTFVKSIIFFKIVFLNIAENHDLFVSWQFNKLHSLIFVLCISFLYFVFCFITIQHLTRTILSYLPSIHFYTEYNNVL